MSHEFDPQVDVTTAFDPMVASPGNPLNYNRNILGEELSQSPQAMPIGDLADFPVASRNDVGGAVEVEGDLDSDSNSNVLGSNPFGREPLNTVKEVSQGFITQGEDLVDHAVGTSADLTKVAVQNASESVHSTINTLAESWNDPNNSVHNALNQQAHEVSNRVGRWVTHLDRSNFMDKVRQHLDTATEWTSSLTETVSNSLGYGISSTDVTEESLALEVAVAKVQADLIDFSQDPELMTKLEAAFGDDWSPEQAQGLIDDLANGREGPQIKVVPEAVLNADGGFGNGQIWLSRRLVAENSDNPGKIAEVITEEWGHALDQQLNSTDSPGDEGDIFARQVRGETLSAAELQSLKQENDHATLFLKGKEIAIEQAAYQIYNDTPARSTATPVNGSDRHLYLQAGTEDQFDAALAAQREPSTQRATDSPQWLRYTPGSVQSGNRVRQWQRRMHLLGFDIEIDGRFGPGSEQVARQFQQANGLEVDGRVGPRTWEASFAETVTPKGPRTPDAVESWNKPKPENPRQADLLSQETEEQSGSSVNRSTYRRKKPENPRQADLLSQELGESSEPTSDNPVVDWIVDNQPVADWIVENQETINRGLGVVQTVDGVVEIVQGVGGILIPEPATSAAGVVIALHGIDTTIAGARTVWTGESQSTVTEGGASWTARTLGASPEASEWIGIGTDFAVGMAGIPGASAARGIREGVDEVVESATDEVADGIVRTQDELVEAPPNAPNTGRDLTEQQRQNQERLARASQFESEVVREATERYTHVWPQITIVTETGVATKLDFVAWDETTGTFILGEAKSTANAPLTVAQRHGFPEIAESGGTVVGQGKPGLLPGYIIPPTEVTIIRPESDWW